MKPTIKDVAKHAGVSVATVSRIVNGLSGYSNETRDHVLKIIKELGYKPNEVARNLVNRKTNTIGVLVPKLSSSFSARLLQGIERVSHQNQYTVFVCNTDSSGTRTLEYLKLLSEKQVEGIVFASKYLTNEYYEAISSLQIPTVIVSSFSKRKELPFLKVNDEEAAYAATEYLIKKGHQRVAMISGPKKDLIAGLPRIIGYHRALSDHHFDLDENLMAYGDFTYTSGYRAIEQLLKKDPNVTAVFAASDEMALGVISYCYEKGIRIPDQLSVIGYDDTELAQMSTPPLTTVHQPIQKMGEKAVETLIKMGKGEKVESRFLPFSIIERLSTRTIR
ncbi:LacI family DNA-binding transcriptional regulator [Metabacillus arenae]|uniref:Substrate-binding domain-containing protein n=1 Tax=Metabacillus arenae TaxID=2771434 RepID=A0A926NKI3_9BACI|nr:substrate-binding domain-containing protein [Metabacillus arenae]MBD1382288.1 substrate-binding domain-containing protein [Metabacillus arenae]